MIIWITTFILRNARERSFAVWSYFALYNRPIFRRTSLPSELSAKDKASLVSESLDIFKFKLKSHKTRTNRTQTRSWVQQIHPENQASWRHKFNFSSQTPGQSLGGWLAWAEVFRFPGYLSILILWYGTVCCQCIFLFLHLLGLDCKGSSLLSLSITSSIYPFVIWHVKQHVGFILTP